MNLLINGKQTVIYEDIKQNHLWVLNEFIMISKLVREKKITMVKTGKIAMILTKISMNNKSVN